MRSRIPLFLFAVCAAYVVLAGSAGAQTPAVPQPTTSPASSGPPAPIASPGFSYSGDLRGYYFLRQNANQYVKNAAGVVTTNPNRTAFLPGGTLHAEYQFGDSGFRIGTSYTGADPFGVNGPNPQKNSKIDNTLPGFSLSTFDEAYANYHSSVLDATVGDRVFNFLWMPASDSRLKPASYQGIDINGKIIPGVTIGASRIIAFENRTDSAFQRATLLTSLPAGASGLKIVDTSGALHAYLDVTEGPLAARFENYSFYDIANLGYADATYKLAKSGLSPFVSVQYVEEHQTGRAVLGTIANNTIGAQIGVSADKNVAFTFGLDSAPTHYFETDAATSAAATKGYFLGSGGTTTSAKLATGGYKVAYGGIASPYTDSYATDPLYTSSLTQGMADRRSPGTSFKLAATYLSTSKRLKAIVSEAYYQYDNLLAENRTFEDDVDIQYFFNPVRKGPYKGFSVRERYGNRVQPSVPDEFKYVRTQLEYDF